MSSGRINVRELQVTPEAGLSALPQSDVSRQMSGIIEAFSELPPARREAVLMACAAVHRAAITKGLGGAARTPSDTLAQGATEPASCAEAQG